MVVWTLRVVWAALPFTAGPAVADALDAWDSAPRVTASVLLWVAWGVGLVAVLAPRPLGLTVQRVIAPAFALTALVVAGGGSASGVDAWLAPVACVAAAALSATPSFSAACAQGAAYGDERRFPLSTPPALFLGPLPLARVGTAAALTAPPILLADGWLVVGTLTLVAGAAVAARLGRSLHALSRRWIVLVPAGVVVADPLALSDPVLFTRRHVRSITPAAMVVRGGDAVDLRLGAAYGSVAVELDEPADLLRAGRPRRAGSHVRARILGVATPLRTALLRTASERRTAAAHDART